ncbi:MAG: histidine kinase [Chlamydiae bacterium CG10_big_fil_rev_8_21_14_0_10_35_9]|nr:MAG: histidine kinase [Chlamydiae bacterium CG10_big_fil_rev_8_21_14_0_10_35_9]
MWSYRKKVVISSIVLLVIFLSLLFPFVEKIVYGVVRNSLEERAQDLIQKITYNSTSIEQVTRKLRQQHLLVFFRVSLINEKGQTLYDSYVEEILGEKYQPNFIVAHPEVREAFKKGSGYEEGYSQLFSQSFAYVAISFNFQGKPYVLRTAFPLKQIKNLTSSFEIGFLTIGAIVLLLFSISTIFILNRLSRPIQHIINSIKPYEEGVLPKIEYAKVIDPNDDFGKLAKTLNSLSEKITDQIKKLTLQKNENESILDSLMEGVLAVTKENKITYINPMACKFLSTAKKDVIGKQIAYLEDKNSSLLELSEKLIEEVKEKEKTIIESFVVQQKQKVFLDIIAIPKEHKQGAILVLQDKTSDYKVIEMGKDFIANASHELRTPITIIRGFAETLEDFPKLSENVMKDITSKIIKTCDRLNSLVNSLLTLADIENFSESRFEKLDLISIIDNSIHMVQIAHENVEIHFEKQSLISKILGDNHLIELAIVNLLENSVKYSKKDPLIHIQVQQKGSEIQLTIQDNGIGIPIEDQLHIFERFYTVDKARSRRFGGAGLGLSIVKTIVEKHGGQIHVSSKVNEGTTFTITFPAFVH